MAYQDMMGQNQQPTDLASAMAQKQARMEDSFFTSLLQYGLADANLPLPDKSKLWNEFVMLKKGRIGQQDLIKFESTYTQAKTINNQKQLDEYKKLVYQGKPIKEVQKLVKDDPILYNNLLDMINDLEKKAMAGDETALQAKSQAELFIPQKSWGEELATDPGVGGSMLPYGAAAATAAAVNVLRKPYASAVADATKRKSYVKKIKAAKANVSNLQKKVNSQASKLKSMQSRGTAKKPILDKAKSLVDKSKEKLSTAKSDLSTLRTSAPAKPDLSPKYKQLAKKIKGGGGLAGQIVGYGALKEGLPAVGSKLYGEKGEKAGSLAGDIGLLGWGLAGLRKGNLVQGAYMTQEGARGLYNRFSPNIHSAVNVVSGKMGDLSNYLFDEE